MRRREWLAFAALLLALTALRRLHALTAPRFFDEDASVFFYEEHYQGASLFTPYAGYCHLLTRSIAKLAALVPTAWEPAVYNHAAWLLTAVACGWFALPAFRHLVRSDRLRMVCCGALALLPNAGEIAITATNVQWWLNLVGFLICFMPMASRRERVAVFIAWLCLTMSSATMFLFVPILLLRACVVPQQRAQLLVMCGLWLSYVVVLSQSRGALPTGHEIQTVVAASTPFRWIR